MCSNKDYSISNLLLKDGPMMLKQDKSPKIKEALNFLRCSVEVSLMHQLQVLKVVRHSPHQLLQLKVNQVHQLVRVEPLILVRTKPLLKHI
jgi:hypothetical protein